MKDQRQGNWRTAKSRYGLRGARLGAAFHPGSSSRQRRSRRLSAVRDSESQDVLRESTQVDVLRESQDVLRVQAGYVVVRGGVAPTQVNAEEIWTVTHGDSDTDSVSAVVQPDDVPPVFDAFIDALEKNLERILAVSEAGGRRVVLIPASPEGTPQSIQDVQHVRGVGRRQRG